eukprot:222757-Chlamydomonas_euryale.AAC.1
MTYGAPPLPLQFLASDFHVLHNMRATLVCIVQHAAAGWLPSGQHATLVCDVQHAAAGWLPSGQHATLVCDAQHATAGWLPSGQ